VPLQPLGHLSGDAKFFKMLRFSWLSPGKTAMPGEPGFNLSAG
jgi:hypothetical protein